MPGVVNYASPPGSVEIRELPVPQIGADDVLLALSGGRSSQTILAS
jgi:hypothetical protein